MTLDRALEDSEIKMAYRFTSWGQVLVALGDNRYIYVNSYMAGFRENLTYSSQANDWLPVERF